MQAVRLVRERLRATPAWLVDAGWVVVAAGVRLLQHSLDAAGHHPPISTEAVVPLVVLAASPLMLRRRFPFAALLAVGTGEFAMLVLDVHAVPVALLVATYSMALGGSAAKRRVALPLLVGAVVVAVAAVEGPELVIETTVSLAMAWVLGSLESARRGHAAEVKRRLELLERERETQAQLAVVEERARIARELHDIVAHGLSVMIMQANGARRWVRGDPERADAAIGEVARAGRTSLAEMRRLLGVLDTGSADPDLAPQPGLERLDDLLDQFRQADLPVELVVDGERRDVPSGVDLSAFRIVQEALTNVLKHGGRVPVTVTLRYRGDTLAIDVLDRGNGAGTGIEPPNALTGRGLIGMHERAAVLGGRLTAGPAPGGGFRVACELPLGPR